MKTPPSTAWAGTATPFWPGTSSPTRPSRPKLGAGYDLVVANIVADVILALAPAVRRYLKPGGAFLCSGIIDDRAEEVARGLRENGWEILETRQSEGWFSYLCR